VRKFSALYAGKITASFIFSYPLLNE